MIRALQRLSESRLPIIATLPAVLQLHETVSQFPVLGQLPSSRPFSSAAAPESPLAVLLQGGQPPSASVCLGAHQQYARARQPSQCSAADCQPTMAETAQRPDMTGELRTFACQQPVPTL